MTLRHATFCGRQRRVVLSSPESVAPNGKITLVKCFAGLASPCSMSEFREEKREDSQAALIFNVAAPDTAHLFHTLHTVQRVMWLQQAAVMSVGPTIICHTKHIHICMYLHTAPPSSCSSNSNRVRSSESYRNSCQSCGPLKLN